MGLFSKKKAKPESVVDTNRKNEITEELMKAQAQDSERKYQEAKEKLRSSFRIEDPTWPSGTLPSAWSHTGSSMVPHRLLTDADVEAIADQVVEKLADLFNIDRNQVDEGE